MFERCFIYPLISKSKDVSPVGTLGVEVRLVLQHSEYDRTLQDSR